MIDISSWSAFVDSVNAAASQYTETQIIMMGVVAGVVLFCLGAWIMRGHDRRKFESAKSYKSGGKR